MSKSKYYLKKPKSEITKDILGWIMVGGLIAIAATSPYFGTNLVREFQKRKHHERKKVYDTFFRLRRQGYIQITKRNRQIYIFMPHFFISQCFHGIKLYINLSDYFFLVN